jgi:spermidine synthase
MIAGAMHLHQGTVNRVIDCGLGAGSSGTWMAQKSGASQVMSVDINPNVLKAAPFFGLPTRENHHLVLGDCTDTIKEAADGTIDIILSDAFSLQLQMPDNMRTQNFYQLVKRKLAPGGTVSINFLSDIYEEPLKQMARTFGGKVHVGHSPEDGNLVAVAVNSDGRSNEVHAIEATADVDIRSWFERANFQPRVVLSS